ncbi:MAG: XRE family transcriptional regulator [Caldilinea sp.]|nr:XRE family transcriptional regulator [Caldilinea sp.]MDW8441047.1 XRE family transcriptional regulator [Caldilineaceae bacterium]
MIRLEPGVLKWARERARLDAETLARKIGVRPERIHDWEQSGRITISQADKLAHHTHTPIGYLYLSEPVEDPLPIPDYRTVADRQVLRPSLELLDTVQAMLRRQAWMRDELIELGREPFSFVGSIGLDSPPAEVAIKMHELLGLTPRWAETERNWESVLRRLRDRIEEAGVLVVFNGVVGNNTHRKLDPDEFRGFALVDEYAPLIFVNAADFKAAQIFTLMHEFAHVMIGRPGVSNFEALEPAPHEVEQFCNRVAAEFLVPELDLRQAWEQMSPCDDCFDLLARRFKVSSLVVARRALDLALIDRETFFTFYSTWQRDERRKQRWAQDGGNFWNSQYVRIGMRFGAAVVRAVKEGRLLYREAYSLIGLSGRAFDKFARQLEGPLMT